jgi:S1-C subfamily serine protease
VIEIVRGSPADHAGLRPEDLILAVGNEEVSDVADLQRLMVAELIGQRVSVRILRGGSLVTLELVPEELELERRARR